ncbi:MAG: hypothetical protein WCC60_09985 [Ilumatobacteraceae bacterium]
MITGLALAGVAGSAGAAFAGVAASGNDIPAPQTQPAPTNPANAEVHNRTISYQVGAAGTVAVTVAGGSLSAIATPGAGWTVVATSAPATHVEVQFTDTLQLVTFAADLVGDDVVVSVSNAAAPGAPATTAVAAPINVTVITNPPRNSPPGTAAPLPATPAPAAPPTATEPEPTEPTHTTQPAPVTTQPAPSATTAPSSGGGDDDDDGEDHGGDDDHEDHEDD